MAGARYTKQIEGFVRFPVDDPSIKNGGGGGMLVKLVVVEPDAYELELGRCTGVQVFDIMTESFIADDKRPLPPELDFDAELSAEDIAKDQKARDDYVAFHYPHLADADALGTDSQLSRGYRASIVMGSTGWSCQYASGKMWHATYDSLTEDGKALYDLMQKLNPGCTLHLLTFLDT